MTEITKLRGKKYGFIYDDIKTIMKRETCCLTTFSRLNKYVKEEKDSYCFPELLCIRYTGTELCKLISNHLGHDNWKDIQVKQIMEIIMNLPEMKDIIPVFDGDDAMLEYRKFDREYLLNNDTTWSIVFGDMKTAIPYKDTPHGKKQAAKENELKANNKIIKLIASDVLKDLAKRYGLRETSDGYYLAGEGFNALVEEALTEKIKNSLAEYGIIINRTNKKPRAWSTLFTIKGLDIKQTEN